MLNQKRSFTVKLYGGENLLEVAAIQPIGSKGFLLEFLDSRGKPARVKIAAQGPVGEVEPKPNKLAVRDAVYNASFEVGVGIPTGWIHGPTEPHRGLNIALTSAAGGSGKQSLRIECAVAARGGLIQRVVVEPGKKYRLSASIRTEGFSGKTFVSLFSNEMHQQLGKTEPLMKADSTWKRYQATWFAGVTRVIYVACYVNGSAGTVYFDDVHLEEVR